MVQKITAGERVTVGQRVVFPVIREEVSCHEAGLVAARDPVALIISDAGRWFFVPLKDGITQDIVSNIS